MVDGVPVTVFTTNLSLAQYVTSQATQYVVLFAVGIAVTDVPVAKLVPPAKVVYQVAVVPRGQVALSVTGVLPKQGMFSVVFENVAFPGFIEVVVMLEFTVAKLVPLTDAMFVTAQVFAGNTFAALIVALKVITVPFPAGKVNGPTKMVSAVALAELFLAD